MAVLWGFDFSEMSWGAFRPKNMYDSRWHLRSERFVIYQIAMLIGMVAQCVCMYTLKKYEFHQDHLFQFTNGRAMEHNNDIVDSFIVSVVFCVFVSVFYGIEYLILVFWPERIYAGRWKTTRKVLGVLVCLGLGAASILSTVIIATHEATVTGVSDSEKQALLDLYFRPPLKYRTWPPNIVFLVFLWISFVFTVASTALLLASSAHDEKFGTDPYPRPGSASVDEEVEPQLDVEKAEVAVVNLSAVKEVGEVAVKDGK